MFLGYVWFSKNLKENMKKKIGFKGNKFGFLYTTSNLFNLF